jgi:mannose-6-phosphate isomerase-like protein (cupin superfamily)
MGDKVNLKAKFASIGTHWTPTIVGDLNGQQVKLVTMLGGFDWHRHEEEDELFLVVGGRFVMELRDREITVEQGEFLIVPRGVDHRPVAAAEAQVLLFEPASTLNTGNVVTARTLRTLERL